MTELDVLDRGIVELRQLLSKCWRDLASSKLTSHERCELRSQMIGATSDLRRYLQAYQAETRRLRELSVSAKCGPQSVRLRFVETDYKLAEGVGYDLPPPAAAFFGRGGPSTGGSDLT